MSIGLHRMAAAAAAAAALLLLGGTACERAPRDAGPWVAAAGRRVPLRVAAEAPPDLERWVEVDLGGDTLVPDGEAGRRIDPASLRVVEVDREGAVVRPDVPHDWELRSRGGSLAFPVRPGTGGGDFHVYYDAERTAEGPPAEPPEARVVVVESGPPSGRGAIVVESRRPDGDPSVTYVYDGAGAAFASIVDAGGADWIGYGPGPDDRGVWRGIPNLGWDGLDADPGFGHPGYGTATTEIVHRGPFRVVLRSRSRNGRWELRSAILPDGVRLTVERVPPGRKYWFLYEGTPGGSLDGSDVCVRSPGTVTDLDEAWTGDLPAPEWVAFASGGRALLLAHLDDDRGTDSYYRLRTMTVFGFGRGAGARELENELSAVPNRFLVALIEDADLERLARSAARLAHPARVRVGRASARR